MKTVFDKGIYLAAIPIFVTGISCLYLLGYWFPFPVQPLLYLSFSEVLNYSLPAIVLCLIAITVGLPLGEYFGNKHVAQLSQDIAKTVMDHPEQNMNQILKQHRYASKYLKVFLIFLCIITGWFQAFRFLILYVSILVAFDLAQIDLLFPTSFSNLFARRVILIIILGLPGYVFVMGLEDGYDVKDNRYFWYVDSAKLSKEVFSRDKVEPLKYIGKLGEHIFLSTLDNDSFVITDDKTIDPLVLQRHKNTDVRPR